MRALVILVGVFVFAIAALVGLLLIPIHKSQETAVLQDTIVPATEAEVAQPAAPSVPASALAPTVVAVAEPEARPAPAKKFNLEMVAPLTPARFIVPTCAIKDDVRGWYDDPKKDHTGVVHENLRYVRIWYPTRFLFGCLSEGTHEHPTLGTVTIYHRRPNAPRRLSAGTHPAPGGTITVLSK